MYVVLLEYSAPISEIDAAMPEHIRWVGEQYDAGHFFASGRRVPRTGGVIIARSMAREQLDAMLAADPFAERNLVRYQVVEFEATRTAPGLSGLDHRD